MMIHKDLLKREILILMILKENKFMLMTLKRILVVNDFEGELYVEDFEELEH